MFAETFWNLIEPLMETPYCSTPLEFLVAARMIAELTRE